MHIAQFETKHLCQILQHLSLEECIAVRPVCRQWKSTVESIAKALTTLKIVVTSSTTENTYTDTDYQNQLALFGLDKDAYLSRATNHKNSLILFTNNKNQILDSSVLFRLLPSVTHLIVHFCGYRQKQPQPLSDCHLLCSLLENPVWSAQLVALSLVGPIRPLNSSGMPPQLECVRLASAINSLVSLRRLDALLTSLCPLPLGRMRLALVRLEHLSLFAYPGDAALALCRLGSPIRRLHLQTHCPLNTRLLLGELAPALIFSAHLRNGLTQLTIRRLATVQILPFITGHFRYLRTLHLHFDPTVKVTFDVKLLLSLNWLQSLVELRLVNVYFESAVFETEFPLIQSLINIKSLQFIELKCSLMLDTNLANHLLMRAFPYVKSIFVSGYEQI